MSHSRVESKTAVKNSIGRLAFCALAILLEVVFIAMMFTKLNRYAPWIQTCTYIVGALLVLAIYAQHKTSSMKTPWIILILVFPVLGVFLYFLSVSTAAHGRCESSMRTLMPSCIRC